MMASDQISILFVDDEPDILHSLRRFLRKEPYRTIFAHSAIEALNILEKEDIHILITDLRMPDMNGLELINLAKQKYPKVLRLILSATRDVEQTIASINTGEVFRFISKPLEPVLFKQIIMDAVDYYLLKSQQKEIMEELSISNTYLASTLKALEKVSTEKEIMEKDALASQLLIERQLLQAGVPEQLEGAQVSALCVPSGQLDGDFYDFVTYDNTRFDLILGDVMGKGVQSILLGAGIKNLILKTLAQHSSSFSPVNATSNQDITDKELLEKTLGQIHDLTIQKLLDLNAFVTLCYARFDLTTSQLTYCDCGHSKTIHYSANTGKYTFLEGTSMPLGLLENADYQAITVPLLPGDLLLFYCNGITQAEDAEGDDFGQERLADFICKNQHLPHNILLETLRRHVIAFSGTDSPQDIFSCIAVRIENEKM